MAVVPRLLLLAASSGSSLPAHPRCYPCAYRPLCSPCLLCYSSRASATVSLSPAWPSTCFPPSVLHRSVFTCMAAGVHVCCHFSHIQLFVTLWTVAHQAPLSMGFSRQERWSGLLCPPPGALPHPGIEPASPAASALSLILYH